MDRKGADAMFEAFREGRLSRRAFVARLLAAGATATSVGALLEACGRTETAPALPDGELGEPEKELAIYNWSDYIAEDVVPAFEAETGIRVTYDTYESNEEMLAKVQLGGGAYDLVVPSGNVLPVLTALGLLFPLSKRYLTNWGNLAPMFLDPVFDRGNTYGVPYQWGTTGIAYRKDKVAEPPGSWAVFHDPRYRGKMTQLDDVRDVIGSWLRFGGHSLNSTSEAELAQAKADAIAAKPLLAAYLSAPVKGPLIAGDVWIAQLWNGDTAQAAVAQPELAYVVPKEGAAITTDSMVIPAKAPHKRAAHEFMNFVLRPDIGAKISDFSGYGTPNALSVDRLTVKLPLPSEEDLKRLEYAVDLGAATELWDRIWTEIKST